MSKKVIVPDDSNLISLPKSASEESYEKTRAMNACRNVGVNTLVIEQEWGNNPYLNEDFVSNMNQEQMEVIIKGLVRKINVSLYADPRFDHEQMDVIYDGLLNRVDVSVYANRKYDAEQMKQILRAIKRGVWKINLVANPELSAEQMFEIVEGWVNGISASEYADPSISATKMREIRERMEKERSDRIEKQDRETRIRHNITKMDGTDMGSLERAYIMRQLQKDINDRENSDGNE
jgi:hypothetical protein